MASGNNQTVSLRLALAGADRVFGLFGKLGKQKQELEKPATIPVDADTDLATEKIDRLIEVRNELADRVANVEVDVNDKKAQAQLIRDRQLIDRIDGYVARAKFTSSGLDRLTAQALTADAALDRINGSFHVSEKSAQGANAAFSLVSNGGMAGLIGAGVILSPILVTLGAGLGGLAVAAVKVAQDSGQMNTILKPLKGTFNQFADSLQPEVLAAFGKGVSIARDLLKDLQPVALVTGKALNGFLGEIDSEFRGGTWQQFFGFMRDHAAIDMQLLGGVIIQLTEDLPPLLEQLQPLAEGFLRDTTAVLKLVDAGTKLISMEQQHARSISDDTGWLGKFGHAATDAFEQLFPGVKVIGAVSNATKDQGKQSLTTAGYVNNLTLKVTDLMTAENNSISALMGYTNALIQQANDAANLSKALKVSHDRIGLQTQAQRDSFSAANTYIGDLLQTSTAAIKSHQSIDKQITSLQNALPQLKAVKGGTREYWLEVQTLINKLHTLQNMKLIKESISVNASGIWHITPGKVGLPGGSVGGFASGGRINVGTGERSDNVLARVSRNETIVSAAHSRILAPAFSMLGVPGYASGGVVGSYHGSVPGLSPWFDRENRATISAVSNAIGKSVSQAVIASSPGGAYGDTGVHSGSAAVAQAFAKSILWAYGWGASQFPPLKALWNQESGWNAYAVNPSSGAAGIPQALGHGNVFSLGDYMSQIRWGLSYISGRYGSPAGAWAHEVANNWYDNGGWLMPGATMAFNGTGRPERVIPPGSSHSGGISGNTTYNINVSVPPTTSPRDVGRNIVDFIAQYEKGSGKRWRS